MHTALTDKDIGPKNYPMRGITYEDPQGPGGRRGRETRDPQIQILRQEFREFLHLVQVLPLSRHIIINRKKRNKGGLGM